MRWEPAKLDAFLGGFGRFLSRVGGLGGGFLGRTFGRLLGALAAHFGGLVAGSKNAAEAKKIYSSQWRRQLANVGDARRLLSCMESSKRSFAG